LIVFIFKREIFGPISMLNHETNFLPNFCIPTIYFVMKVYHLEHLNNSMDIQMVYKNVVDVSQWRAFFLKSKLIWILFAFYWRMLMESLQLGTRQTFDPIKNGILENIKKSKQQQNGNTHME